MDHEFVCPACRMNHSEPAYAGLGHRIACLACADHVIDEAGSTQIAASHDDNFGDLAA